jgi:hypothetical protein
MDFVNKHYADREFSHFSDREFMKTWIWWFNQTSEAEEEVFNTFLGRMGGWRLGYSFDNFSEEMREAFLQKFFKVKYAKYLNEADGDDMELN